MELEAGCVVWSIRRLRGYLFGVYFMIFTDHECLKQICKIGETKPRIQRWMEFLSAHNFGLSYRRGRDNANADFLSRLPLPPIEEDIFGLLRLVGPRQSWRLSNPRMWTYHPLLPHPGRWLGWASPVTRHRSMRWHGWAETLHRKFPVSGGLPLTKDDFRTHRAPMSPRHMTARPNRPRATPPEVPCTAYAINDSDAAPRRRTRSQTAISEGNAPSRPDYRTAARSGFAAPAASAPPPSPRVARLRAGFA